MASWNPNATGLMGLEFFPSIESVVTLDSILKNVCMPLRQTAAEITGTCKVGVGAIPVRNGLYVVEVYDGETAVISGRETLYAQPNEQVSGNGTGAGQWREDDDTTTTIYSEIDETVCSETDYIYTDGVATAGRYTSRFNTGGLTLASKRVLALTLRMAGDFDGSGSGNWSAGLSLGGVDYYAWQNTIADHDCADNGKSFTWLYNPSTNLPWTIADVQALDTTDEWWVEATLSSTSGELLVYWVRLEVELCTENRIAVGTMNDAASALTANAYNTVTLLTPTGGAWTKDGAGYHTIMVRRISSNGALSIPILDSGVAANPAYGFDPTLDATYGYATAMNTAITRLFPYVSRTTAPADSVDSQPYYDLLTAQVYTGQDAEQEFSSAAAADYGLITFLCKPGSATTALSIKLKRRSDDVQFGSTFSLATSLTGTGVISAVAKSNGWYLVTVSLTTPGTLAAATQYYIEFSSTTAATVYWSVVALSTTTGNGEAASFGGTTDRALVNATEADYYDIPVTIATVPSAPTGLAVSLGSQVVDPTVCGVDQINYAALDWTTVALGATFSRYEIRRSDDGELTWETVAYINVEGSSNWADYEARRNMTSCYQVRVLRTDGAYSAWSSSVCRNIPAEGAAVYFTSNYTPSLNVAYERDPTVTYDLLDANTQVTHPIYGRDRQLGFQPTEELGVVAHMVIAVGFNDRVPTSTMDTGGVSVRAFDPLRAIAKAAIPYVCVLDAYGGRLYAMLAVPSGSHLNPGERYLAEIGVTETSDTAYIVTAP